jgi:AbrB family looped-hinge helix DNA binding protein
VAIIGSKGRVTLPAAIRKQLQLEPGDAFAVVLEDEDTVLLHREPRRPNAGLVKLLLACPYPFDAGPRDADDGTS